MSVYSKKIAATSKRYKKDLLDDVSSIVEILKAGGQKELAKHILVSESVLKFNGKEYFFKAFKFNRDRNATIKESVESIMTEIAFIEGIPTEQKSVRRT